MRKMDAEIERKDLRYDWKGELLAVILGLMIFAPVVVEWIYWTNNQLVR
jgi:hypothetical protein